MWLGRAEKRHARLLACPVSWQYDLGWHSMITGSWPAASVNRIWLIHILYFSTSHTYTLEYKSVLFSYSWDVTLGRGVTSERTIAKPLTPEKTRTRIDGLMDTVHKFTLSEVYFLIIFGKSFSFFFSCQEHFISEMPKASVLKRGQIRGWNWRWWFFFIVQTKLSRTFYIL